ncbi:MAG TPA: hypothetical protein DEP23_11055 [Ruminococcaceae bacterium]|nr:hypothetical protein [Oscillospiraceae bacterium]
MLNEIAEFAAYTGEVNYTAQNKYDSTYLGRFTFDTLLKFEGLFRILTIIARGYMFKNGTEPQIETARQALQAWCSIPDNKKSSPKEDWRYKTDFRDLNDTFPELVDENGCGWYYCHVYKVLEFIRNNPDKVMKTALNHCDGIRKGFDSEWRKKLLQFQVPLFSPNTKGAWILRFDDVLADALELGELKNKEVAFTDSELQMIEAATPQGVPTEVLSTLIAYYRANKPDDSDWVVLPVANFDAYFGNTSFSRKWLAKMPSEIVERQKQSFGVCRYRVVGNADFIF